jgi:hypothetical protein
MTKNETFFLYQYNEHFDIYSMLIYLNELKWSGSESELMLWFAQLIYLIRFSPCLIFPVNWALMQNNSSRFVLFLELFLTRKVFVLLGEL